MCQWHIFPLRCMFPASWPSLLAGCRFGLTTKRWGKDASQTWSHQLLFQKMCQDFQFWAKPHIVQVPARVALGVTTLLAMSTTQVWIFCKLICFSSQASAITSLNCNQWGKNIFCKRIFSSHQLSAVTIPILPAGQHPKLTAPGGLHKSHRRVVRGVCLLCL